MERWDFVCQICKEYIGNAFYVSPEWYRCPEYEREGEKLEKVYPRFTFDEEGNIISGASPLLFSSLLRDTFIKEQFTKEEIAKNRNLRRRHITAPPSVIIINYSELEAIWADNANDKKWYEKAGIKKHETVYRRSNLGYTIDAKCAQELGYKCPTCDTPLEKVTADQHPGGQWGIVGVREPAPMQPSWGKTPSSESKPGSEKFTLIF